MTVSIGIILILCLYTVVGVLDQISIQIGPYTPLFAATFTGLVLGDVQTGLMIGATLQYDIRRSDLWRSNSPRLSFRGHYGNGLCNHFRKGAEYGIGVAVPIGLLLTQLDILGRMANTFSNTKQIVMRKKAIIKGSSAAMF